jgi:hypothetical protein
LIPSICKVIHLDDSNIPIRDTNITFLFCGLT